MEGGAGAGLAGSEGPRKEVISLGVPSAAVCLGWKSGYGGGIYQGPQSLSGPVGPQPALPSTVRLTSPKPLV